MTSKRNFSERAHVGVHFYLELYMEEQPCGSNVWAALVTHVFPYCRKTPQAFRELRHSISPLPTSLGRSEVQVWQYEM